MTDAEKIAYLTSKLKALAVNKTRFEEYGPDYSPSMYENNAEDGYYAGLDDGETRLARELLTFLEG